MKKIVVMGFGSSGQRFVSVIKKSLPLAEILVVSSQQAEIPGVRFTSQLAAVTSFRPDIAVICGAASSRHEMIQALPRTTYGILVEKPLARSHSDGMKIADLFAGWSVLVQVGYNLRFSPSLNDLKHRIDELELGPVLSVRAEVGQYLPSWRPERDYRTSVSASEAAGGGVLRELSHEVDFLRWIFGDAEWVSAWHGRVSDLDIDVEDTAHLLIGFPGATAKDSLVANLSVDFVRRDSTRSLTVVCADGSFRWNGIASTVDVMVGDSGRWEQVCVDEPSSKSTYELEWDSFLASLSIGATPLVTVNDGLAVLQIIDAARLSHESGGIRVPVALGAET